MTLEQLSKMGIAVFAIVMVVVLIAKVVNSTDNDEETIPCPPTILPAEPQKTPREYEPPPQRHIPAGELMAFWEAWDKCKGPTCID